MYSIRANFDSNVGENDVAGTIPVPPTVWTNWRSGWHPASRLLGNRLREERPQDADSQDRQAAGLWRLVIVRRGRQGGPDVGASRYVGE